MKHIIKHSTLIKHSVLAASMLVLAACGDGGKVDNQASSNEAGSPSYEQQKLTADQALMQVADLYYAVELERNPIEAYFIGEALDHHDGFESNDLATIKRYQDIEDGIYQSLLSVQETGLTRGPNHILYAKLREHIEASRDQRICHRELWNVNHMGGLHSSLGRVAGFAPLETDENKADALARWTKVAAYFDQEISNLKAGLAEGYSAPKAVVDRVVGQLDGLLAIPLKQSPILEKARAADDAAFLAKFQTIIGNTLMPALTRYRDYLAGDYKAAARDSRALSANPDGVACYKALYRGYTTLQRTAKDVHDIGDAAVKANMQDVIHLGQQLYDLDDFSAIIKRVGDDPANGFDSLEAMHADFEAIVDRATAAMPSAFNNVSKRQLVVKPYPDYLAGKGMSARYERGDGTRDAVFRYDPISFDRETRGGAERVTIHEGYPGHHMQISVVQDLKKAHPVEEMLANSAIIEGWARYAEALAEEMGIYQTDFAKVERRAWPARGMVADTGLHVLGWTNQQVMDYFKQSGNFDDKTALNMLDRIAAIPAQLTSYDSGGLEIFALRREAQAALGDRFDLKTFHDKILENGFVPLQVLRDNVEGWIATVQAQ